MLATRRVISLATVGSRNMWLALTTVRKGLFRSISSVAECLKRLEEETLQLSHHLQLGYPQRGTEETR